VVIPVTDTYKVRLLNSIFQFYICYWQSYETINEKQSSVHFILFTWRTSL